MAMGETTSIAKSSLHLQPNLHSEKTRRNLHEQYCKPKDSNFASSCCDARASKEKLHYRNPNFWVNMWPIEVCRKAA
ncbi:hypothetical protein VIGAN_08312400 [Vigna angularis var. angularis]|uniref:Uncharacterized protein n=1 Tax=Vigna angularis var. angularis TaxID=157739 RepID=A0A0S3STQ9_PHAAN|nr:hypothetical protein VIGAN_08312400 [Vigna angularis var. angularis]